MTDRISGSVFKQMVLFGAACITIEREAINDLNVFPVPDGDTGTNIPVGSMANHELRTLRRTAHHYFDRLYESGYMSKQDAYQWLADLIMAPLSEAHIGYLGEYYCKQVIDESKKLLERRKATTQGRPYMQKGGALAS